MPGSRCQPANGWFVLVAGWPGSGKSTLAAALAAGLGMPLLAKDEIEENVRATLATPLVSGAAACLHLAWKSHAALVPTSF